jgi:predicted kinase
MTLYLLCGIPASGKSSYAAQVDGVWVSRDKIRFSLIQQDEEYFSHEKEVFNEFVRQIDKGLSSDGVVYADATHLNEKSRNKLLNRLNLNGVDIVVINFKTPLETCLERNSKRVGKERVPEDVMYKMARSFKPATFYEKYRYKDIITKED